jgi:hypothetical protein
MKKSCLRTVFLVVMGCWCVSAQTSSIQLLSAGPAVVSPGGTVTLTVRVTNTGGGTWTPVNTTPCPDLALPIPPCTGQANTFGAAVGVFPAGNGNVMLVGGSFVMPGPVGPGASVDLTGTFTIGLPVGSYTLVPWTLVFAVAGFGPSGGLSSNMDVFVNFPHFELAVVPQSAFLVGYAANLAIGESVVNLTNAGSISTVAFDGVALAQNGDVCANVYAYSSDEQLVSCCSCNVTPNALNSLAVRADLASNTLTPIVPSALVLKIVATPGGGSCTASSAATVTASSLVPGLLAWGTRLHALPVTPGSPVGTFGLTEVPFAVVSLSEAELRRMTSLCAFIRANGSGYGVCKSCRQGGLGAASR